MMFIKRVEKWMVLPLRKAVCEVREDGVCGGGERDGFTFRHALAHRHVGRKKT